MSHIYDGTEKNSVLKKVTCEEFNSLIALTLEEDLQRCSRRAFRPKRGQGRRWKGLEHDWTLYTFSWTHNTHQHLTAPGHTVATSSMSYQFWHLSQINGVWTTVLTASNDHSNSFSCVKRRLTWVIKKDSNHLSHTGNAHSNGSSINLLLAILDKFCSPFNK